MIISDDCFIITDDSCYKYALQFTVAALDSRDAAQISQCRRLSTVLGKTKWNQYLEMHGLLISIV